MSFIQLEDVSVEYGKKNNKLLALKHVDFAVEQGEFVAVMGKSGCGKTTLLNVLGTLLTPTSGEYKFDGISVLDMNDQKKALFRN